MNKVIQLGGSAAFIPTFENAAYGIRVLLLGGLGDLGSKAGSGSFYSHLVRSDYATYYGFFTTVKLD